MEEGRKEGVGDEKGGWEVEDERKEIEKREVCLNLLLVSFSCLKIVDYLTKSLKNLEFSKC